MSNDPRPVNQPVAGKDDSFFSYFDRNPNLKPVLALVTVLFTVFTFFAAQFIAGAFVSIYPLMKHWSHARTNAWIEQSVGGQFVYIVLAEALTLLGIYIFLRKGGIKWRTIGLRKPKWTDPAWGLAFVPLYFVSYLVIVGIVRMFVPELNISQSQQIGFTDAHSFGSLLITFVSLVLLPPFVEEIMVRGFLYTGLKKAMPMLSAVLMTSIIFASAHLQAGSGAPLLWIAFIDTFVLSLFLIALREKTHGLWASMTLHASKNLIAFVMLFIFHLS